MKEGGRGIGAPPAVETGDQRGGEQAGGGGVFREKAQPLSLTTCVGDQ